MKKRPQPYRVEDFMPYMERSPEEIEREVAASLFHALASPSEGRKLDKAERSRRRREVGRSRK